MASAREAFLLSFPQFLSSCLMEAKVSAVKRIWAKVFPLNLAQAARALHSISTAWQPASFTCSIFSFVSRKKASVVQTVQGMQGIFLLARFPLYARAVLH